MKTSTTLLVTCIVVVGYLLSPPFVTHLATVTWQEEASKRVNAFYVPAYSLANAFPPYMRLLEWEYRLIVP